MLDVRTEAEFAHDGVPGSIHAPGGQLVQATDEWIAVREANLLLLDSDGVRAPLVAYWLRQMGHKATVLEGGIEAARALSISAASITKSVESVPELEPPALNVSSSRLIDLRSSLAYREGHIDGSTWSIRPRLADLGFDNSQTIVLIGAPTATALAARDLVASGAVDVRRLSGTPDDWRAAGLAIVETPDNPSDDERIDHLFFTAERRYNKDASRQYLKWEIDLVDQLDDQERAMFHLVGS